MMDRETERIEDRRSQVVTDLEELSGQVDAGELDSETADRLRHVYTAELAEIDSALAVVADTPTRDEESVEPTALRLSRPVAIGGAMLLGILTGIIILLGTRSTSDVAATPPEVAVEAGAVDVASMSIEDLESSLASFPESVTARLALADRYLAAGQRTDALEHYLIVAAGEAQPADLSRALARIGYLSYVTGQYEAARGALLDSLLYDTDNTEAALYLGYVLLNGFNDMEAATVYFEQALADPTMPLEIAHAVSDILANTPERSE